MSEGTPKIMWIWAAVFFAVLIGLSVTTYVVAFGLDVKTVDTRATSSPSPTDPAAPSPLVPAAP